MTTDLSHFFSLSPDETTDADIEEIIRAFRDRRKQFLLGDDRAGSTKKESARVAEARKAAGPLNLKDLLK